MKRGQARISRPAPKELITFIAVLGVCLGLAVYLGVSAPAEKRIIDYLAQGIFSALFAVPTGAAWLSLRQEARGQVSDTRSDREGRD